MEDLLSSIDKDIFSKDDREKIKRHLLAMKCDPAKINSFIWFLDRTELWQMKYAVMPNYKGNMKKGVLRFYTKKRGNWVLTKDDIELLLKKIKGFLEWFQYSRLIPGRNKDFYLHPVYRNFYESGEFSNLTVEIGDKMRDACTSLIDLQSLMKKAVAMATFTRRGRTPLEYRTDFTFHIVHLFYMYFGKLPSATTKNSRFQKIVEICYRTVGLEPPNEAADASKTIRKAILRYRKELNQ